MMNALDKLKIMLLTENHIDLCSEDNSFEYGKDGRIYVYNKAFKIMKKKENYSV